MTEDKNKGAAWAEQHQKHKAGGSSWKPPEDVAGEEPPDIATLNADPRDASKDSSGQNKKSLFPYWNSTREDFPVSALPEAIQGAVIEVCLNDKVPDALAAQAALSAVSIACQDLIRVDRGQGLVSTCSLFMLAVADTSSRKTRADDLLTMGIREYDAEARAQHEAAEKQHELDEKFWSANDKALTRAYIKARTQAVLAGIQYDAERMPAAADQNENEEVVEGRGRDGADAVAMSAHSTTAIVVPGKDAGTSNPEGERTERELMVALRLADGDLRKHAATRPPKPRLRRLLYAQAAITDLERGLYENWPAAGLFSNEGADILLRRTVSDMARLDRLWDGQAIDVVGQRKSENVYVGDPRLTMSLMIQPYLFDSFLQRKGEAANGIGFMARTLISRPWIPYGERTVDRERHKSIEWQGRFNERIKALLEWGRVDFDGRAKRRQTLRFSAQAQQLLDADHNAKEKETAKGGKYVYERPFIGRYSEHVARVAALFHFFEKWDSGNEDEKNHERRTSNWNLEIQVDTLRRAIEICEWYLKQYRSVFNPDEIVAADAQELLEVFERRLKAEGLFQDEPTYGSHTLPVSKLSPWVPSRLRHAKNKERFEMALDWLVRNRKVEIIDKKPDGSAGSRTVRLVVKQDITRADIRPKPFGG